MTLTPPPLDMATYWVVPLMSDSDQRAQPCRYFTLEGQPVGADQLQCRSQGFRTDFICLRQADEAALSRLPVGNLKVDPDARLFGAVAKTLHQSAQMPNQFLAEHQRVVIPVAGRSQRGLLLIFEHARGGAVQFLTASTDPIIKNTGD